MLPKITVTNWKKLVNTFQLFLPAFTFFFLLNLLHLSSISFGHKSLFVVIEALLRFSLLLNSLLNASFQISLTLLCCFQQVADVLWLYTFQSLTVTSSSAMAARPCELDQRFQMGVNLRLL